MKALYTKTSSLLLLSLILFFGTSSCKDDDNTGANGSNTGAPPTFEERITGSWEVKLAQYNASIDFQGFPVTLAGTDPNASGVFEMGTTPNTVSYNVSITASFDLGGGAPAFPLPISQNGSGTWRAENNNKKLVLSLNDGTQQEFNILLDEPNVQVWQGITPVNIPFIGSIEPDVTLTLVKQN